MHHVTAGTRLRSPSARPRQLYAGRVGGADAPVNRHGFAQVASAGVALTPMESVSNRWRAGVPWTGERRYLPGLCPGRDSDAGCVGVGLLVSGERIGRYAGTGAIMS